MHAIIERAKIIGMGKRSQALLVYTARAEKPKREVADRTE
jgi:hypothetical protein